MFAKMLKPYEPAILLLCLLALSPPAPPAAAAAATPAEAAATNATCPLDLSYVPTYPWDHSSCDAATANHTDCNQTLLSLYGIALAERLRDTGHFRLPDYPTSAACLSAFQSALSSPPLRLSSSLVSTYFPDPQRFVITPYYCAGILTAAGFAARLRNSNNSAAAADLGSACRSGLADLTRCEACLNAGLEVSSALVALDGNTSRSTNCFYLTVTYAAGVDNQPGPKYPPTANCILGLALSSSSSPPPTQSSNSHTPVAALAASLSAASVLLLIASILGFFLFKSHKKKKKQMSRDPETPEGHRSHPRPNTGSILFDIKELEKATSFFSQTNLIGRGGFGVVYKGVLADSSVVAVKKVLDPSCEGSDEELRNEVEIISNLRHRNLVPLRGCCIADVDADEGRQWFLVYDYMPNGSLERHIFTSERQHQQRPLTWPERRSIILDVAKGLEYLHYGVKPAIYHRDIKATNILLDREMRARVADFGLARQSREGQSHLTTRVAGTHGYLAPEYALYGQLTEKSDVYSFGVLLLEVMSGRRALDMAAPANMILITDWAWAMVKAGRAQEVFDEGMVVDGGDGGTPRPRGVMERFVLVGVLCAHVMVALRPTIPEALRMLEGDAEVPEIPDRPLPLGGGFGYRESGSTFSASPALSGLCFDTGDMLR